MNNINDKMMPTEETISLLSYALLIWKNRRIVLSVTIFAVIISIVISLLQTKIYTSTAIIMPLTSGGSDMSAKLAALTGNPMFGGFQSQSPNANLVNILQSRSLREDVIDKLDLKKIFFAKSWDKKNKKWNKKEPSMQVAAKMLGGMTSTSLDRKSNLITISVKYKDPEIAAKIANTYTILLDDYLNNNSITNAKRSRIFIENQIKTKKSDLSNVQKKLLSFSENSDSILVEKKVSVAITKTSELLKNLASKELSLSFLSKYNPDKKEEMGLLHKEIDGLSQQIKKMTFDITGNSTNGEKVLLPFQKVPVLALEYASLKQEMMVLNEVVALLQKQLELSKIDEVKEDIHCQVLDKAVPPEQRSSPNRKKNVMMAFVVSLFASIGSIFAKEYMKNELAVWRSKKQNDQIK